MSHGSASVGFAHLVEDEGVELGEGAALEERVDLDPQDGLLHEVKRIVGQRNVVKAKPPAACKREHGDRDAGLLAKDEIGVDIEVEAAPVAKRA